MSTLPTCPASLRTWRSMTIPACSACRRVDPRHRLSRKCPRAGFTHRHLYRWPRHRSAEHDGDGSYRAGFGAGAARSPGHAVWPQHHGGRNHHFHAFADGWFQWSLARVLWHLQDQELRGPRRYRAPRRERHQGNPRLFASPPRGYAGQPPPSILPRPRLGGEQRIFRQGRRRMEQVPRDADGRLQRTGGQSAGPTSTGGCADRSAVRRQFASVRRQRHPDYHRCAVPLRRRALHSSAGLGARRRTDARIWHSCRPDLEIDLGPALLQP